MHSALGQAGCGGVLLIFITFFHPLLLADKRPARCLEPPHRWSSSASAARTQLQLGLKNSLMHGSSEVICHQDLVLLSPSTPRTGWLRDAEAAVEEAEGEAIVGGLETSAQLGVGCCCFLLVPPRQSSEALWFLSERLL